MDNIAFKVIANGLRGADECRYGLRDERIGL